MPTPWPPFWDDEKHRDTIAGTGAPCACGHGSDLHDLDRVTLLGDLQDPSIGWLFRCRGAFAPRSAIGSLVAFPCSCDNFRQADA
jgi:hypothetical protein